jgi:hypothetical protein
MGKGALDTSIKMLCLSVELLPSCLPEMIQKENAHEDRNLRPPDVLFHRGVRPLGRPWLKRQGGEVQRYNLSQQPAAFANNPVVKEALAKEGNDCLPLTMVDGAVALKSRYPTREMLAAYAGIKISPSIFTDAVKELVAIGAAIGSSGEDALEYHCSEARKLGVSQDDLRLVVEMAQSVKDRTALSTWELAQKHISEPPAG